MAEFEKTRIECVEESENGRSAKFVVEPLEKGDGITLGTALRRIMLSQISGAAATAISIDGISHEFSTIPGVKEDVTDIVLNLKSVNFKLHTDFAEVIIDHEGEGVITAGDIECGPDVEILNPEQHIATLNEDARVYISIIVKSGKGWCVAEKNKQADQAIGTIPIDSIFSPIEKVNVTVENTLVGDSTDFEKLIIEVETNGAITPLDAIREAGAILIKKIQIFSNGNELPAEPVDSTPIIEQIGADVYSTPIELLELSVRSTNCLRSEGIRTVGELAAKTPDEIKKIHNCGTKSYEEILKKLEDLHINFGESSEG